MEPNTDDTNADIAAALDHPDDRIGNGPDIPGLTDGPDLDTIADPAVLQGATGGADQMNDTAGSGDHTDLDDAISQSDASGQIGGSRPAD